MPRRTPRKENRCRMAPSASAARRAQPAYPGSRPRGTRRRSPCSCCPGARPWPPVGAPPRSRRPARCRGGPPRPRRFRQRHGTPNTSLAHTMHHDRIGVDVRTRHEAIHHRSGPGLPIGPEVQLLVVQRGVLAGEVECKSAPTSFDVSGLVLVAGGVRQPLVGHGRASRLALRARGGLWAEVDLGVLSHYVPGVVVPQGRGLLVSVQGDRRGPGGGAGPAVVRAGWRYRGVGAGLPPLDRVVRLFAGRRAGAGGARAG